MALDKRSLTIVAGSLMVLACIFFIVSTALPSWATASGPGFSYEAGLWATCKTILGSKTCSSIGSCSSTGNSQCGKLNGGRAFMILAILTSAVAAVAILMNLMSNASNQMMLLIMKALGIVSLICGVIGVALGISSYSDGNGKLGAGSILGIVALVINLVAAIVAALIN